MTADQQRVEELVREMYETAENADWDLTPEQIRMQRRRPLMLLPDAKAYALVGAAIILIIAGFFVFSRPAAHHPAVAARSTSTTTSSTINPTTLAATLACLQDFAPGTSQPDGVLVGKSLSAARKLAAATGQSWRVVAQDGTCNSVTTDLQSNRVDLWIVDGRVVKAVLEGATSTTTSEPTNRNAQSVVIPNTIGTSQSQAANAISEAGLNVGKVTSVPSATVGSGQVVSESPVAGSSVALGSSVDLVVADGR
jgi:hypothetical protein